MKLFLLALVATAAAHSASKSPVYRLAHFDSKLLAHGGATAAFDEASAADGDSQDTATFRESTQFGSRQAALSLTAVAAPSADDGKSNKEDLLSRKVAVVKLVDVDYKRFVGLLKARRAAGLLVLLPTSADLANVRGQALQCCAAWLLGSHCLLPHV